MPIDTHVDHCRALAAQLICLLIKGAAFDAQRSQEVSVAQCDPVALDGAGHATAYRGIKIGHIGNGDAAIVGGGQYGRS